MKLALPSASAVASAPHTVPRGKKHHVSGHPGVLQLTGLVLDSGKLKTDTPIDRLLSVILVWKVKVSKHRVSTSEPIY